MGNYVTLKPPNLGKNLIVDIQASSSVVPLLGDWRCTVTPAVPVGLPTMTAGAVPRLAEPVGSTASEVIGSITLAQAA